MTWFLAIVAIVSLGNVVWGGWAIWEQRTTISVGKSIGKSRIGGRSVSLSGNEAIVNGAARAAIAIGVGLAATVAIVRIRRREFGEDLDEWVTLGMGRSGAMRLLADIAGGAISLGGVLVGVWEILQQTARVEVGPDVYYYTVSGIEAALYGVCDVANGMFWGAATAAALGGSALRSVRTRGYAGFVGVVLMAWCAATVWIAVLRIGRGEEHFSGTGYYGGPMAMITIGNDLVWTMAWLAAAVVLIRFAREPFDSRAARLLVVAGVLAGAHAVGAIGLVLVGLVRASFF